MIKGIAGNFGRDGVSDSAVKTVSFEARSFEELGEQVTGWVDTHSREDIVSISHSTGARWEKRYDKVSFGKLEPVNTYTAFILVRDEKAA